MDKPVNVQELRNKRASIGKLLTGESFAGVRIAHDEPL